MRPWFLCFAVLFASAGFAADGIAFEKTVFPVLEAADCRSCHNPEGVASPTRLQFPELNSPSDQVQAFGKSLVSLINPESIEKSPLLLKPTLSNVPAA